MSNSEHYISHSSHDVFVSYSSEDKPIADALVATLEANRIRCWIAPRDVLPGLSWAGAIVDAINQSQLMVLVYSSRSNQSKQVAREVERAANKGIPILPFRIEDVPLSKDMEYFISTSHWLDALSPPLERHLQHLAETVGLLLSRIAGPEETSKSKEARPIVKFTTGESISTAKSKRRKRTPVILAIASIALVAVIAMVLIFVIGLGQNGGKETSPVASATPGGNVPSQQPTVQPSNTIPPPQPTTQQTNNATPIPQRGPLLYQAKLDGTSGDVKLPTGVVGDSKATDIKFLPGDIDLIVLRDGGSTGISMNTTARLRYMIEFDLSFEPGSEMYAFLNLIWSQPTQTWHEIQISSADEFLELDLVPNSVVTEHLTPRIPIPGIWAGKAFKITAIVDEGRYIIFLNDNLVADVTDSRMDEVTNPSVWVKGSKGTLHVKGIRIYQLQ